VPVSVRRLAPSFCGEVAGVDLSRLDDDATEADKSARHRHRVQEVHGQDLDEDRLVADARRLGEVEIHLRQTRTTGRREVMLVSNKKENGQPIDRLGNQELNWHMDQIFMAEPTAGTILYAVEVTPEGGETWFCDLAAAYEALPLELKARIEGRRAMHSAATADRRVGIRLTEEQRKRASEVVHPLVRTHPLSDEKSLYFSLNHTARIDGLSEADSLPLLEELRTHATRPDFVYRHHWRVGDLVMWDDRCTMHRARDYDRSYTRDLHRTAVMEEAPALAEAQVA
jgi:taurine dioxygenase